MWDTNKSSDIANSFIHGFEACRFQIKECEMWDSDNHELIHVVRRITYQDFSHLDDGELTTNPEKSMRKMARKAGLVSIASTRTCSPSRSPRSAWYRMKRRRCEAKHHNMCDHSIFICEICETNKAIIELEANIKRALSVKANPRKVNGKDIMESTKVLSHEKGIGDVLAVACNACLQKRFKLLFRQDSSHGVHIECAQCKGTGMSESLKLALEDRGLGSYSWPANSTTISDIWEGRRAKSFGMYSEGDALEGLLDYMIGSARMSIATILNEKLNEAIGSQSDSPAPTKDYSQEFEGQWSMVEEHELLTPILIRLVKEFLGKMTAMKPIDAQNYADMVIPQFISKNRMNAIDGYCQKHIQSMAVEMRSKSLALEESRCEEEADVAPEDYAWDTLDTDLVFSLPCDLEQAEISEKELVS